MDKVEYNEYQKQNLRWTAWRRNRRCPAVTGNILGAWLGYDAIEEKWKRNLEFRRIILELADDLYEGRNLDQGMLCGTQKKRLHTAWECKYFDAKLSRPGKEA